MAAAMQQTGNSKETSPLSSEFEDLGIEDDSSSAVSGAAAESSDWTEGGEESFGRRSSSFTSPSQAQMKPPPVQTAEGEGHVEPNPEQQADAGHLSPDYQRQSSRLPGDPGDQVLQFVATHTKETLKELEEAGHKVADTAKHLASNMSRKLFGGSATAGGGDSGATVDESFSMNKIAADVSSWWSALDPSQPSSSPSPGKPQAKTNAQQLFGLPATETLLEEFACDLVQTCSCTHNVFTGPQEVTWRGVLYITDRHSCWKADADSTTLMLPHTDVTAVQKTASSSSGRCGSLKISFGESNEHLVFRDFKGPADESVDGALALLEHLTTSDA